jgi:hypothetical protein
MKAKVVGALVMASTVLAACESDPTGPEHFDTEELTAALVVEPHHFHTWETTGEFTVSVVDPNGDPVTDFEDIRLQRRREGAQSWGNIALTLDGDFYTGTYVFDTPGNYDLQIMGQREGDAELVLMYEAPAPLEVVNAHSTLGGYTVEFQAIPGHIHAHDTAAFQFTFSAAGAHQAALTSAAHPPAQAPTILLGDNGSLATYTATETAPGVWSASHTFAAAVPVLPVSVRFTGTDQQLHTYTVDITIAEAH